MERYIIIDEYGEKTDPDILVLFYGNSWQSTVDRMPHDIDGHVVTIHFQGHKFKVFRKEFIGNLHSLGEISKGKKNEPDFCRR